MKKTGLFVVLSVIIAMMLAGTASAHVTVQPSETTQGQYESFTIRVPTEKEIATIQVEVKFPEGVAISRFEPKYGWTYTVTRDGSDKIIGVVWKATEGGLGPTEFGDFHMSGKVESNAKDLVWKAYQTYTDGSVVEWVGAAGSDKPASVTKVKAAPAGAADHGHDTGASHTGEETPANANSNLPLILSIVACVLGALALLIAVTKRKA